MVLYAVTVGETPDHIHPSRSFYAKDWVGPTYYQTFYAAFGTEIDATQFAEMTTTTQ